MEDQLLEMLEDLLSLFVDKICSSRYLTDKGVGKLKIGWSWPVCWRVVSISRYQQDMLLPKEPISIASFFVVETWHIPVESAAREVPSPPRGFALPQPHFGSSLYILL